MEGVICFLGIGSNLGERRANCIEAMERLARTEGVSATRHSSLYRTEPVGGADQPWFVNAVAEIRTWLDPEDLLMKLQAIEKEMGRREKGTGGPRTVDIDILLYGQAVIHGDDLMIPHRELHRRRFVLVPLNEIAPWAVHPLFGISARGLMDRLGEGGLVEKIGESS